MAPRPLLGFGTRIPVYPRGLGSFRVHVTFLLGEVRLCFFGRPTGADRSHARPREWPAIAQFWAGLRGGGEGALCPEDRLQRGPHLTGGRRDELRCGPAARGGRLRRQEAQQAAAEGPGEDPIHQSPNRCGSHLNQRSSCYGHRGTAGRLAARHCGRYGYYFRGGGGTFWGRGWSEQRVQEYFEWAAQVAKGLQGTSPQMEEALQKLFQERGLSL